MKRFVWSAAVVTLMIAPAGLEAQLPGTPPPITYGDGRRAQATRAELEATLEEIDRIVASPGYSARLRDARRREAELIRDRLQHGDLQTGDAVLLTVLNEPQLSTGQPLLIGPGQVLSLPGIPDIVLRGALRSEAEARITEALRRQFRDPQVQVQTNIRLTITGMVARPGFHQVPADIMPTDAIMTVAQGFVGNADPGRTIIRRQGREIWSRDAFQDALLRGLTLDQMNLRTNDEIAVAGRPGNRGQTALVALGAVSSIAYLVHRLVRGF